MGLSENRVPQNPVAYNLSLFPDSNIAMKLGIDPIFGQTQIIKITSLQKNMVFYQMFRFSWIINTSYHFLQQKLKVDQKQSKNIRPRLPRDHMGI